MTDSRCTFRRIVAVAMLAPGLVLSATAERATADTPHDPSRQVVATDAEVEVPESARQGANGHWYWLDLDAEMRLSDLNLARDDDWALISIFVGEWAQLQVSLERDPMSGVPVAVSNGSLGAEPEDLSGNRLVIRRKNLLQSGLMAATGESFPVRVELSSSRPGVAFLSTVTIERAAVIDDDQPPPGRTVVASVENDRFSVGEEKPIGFDLWGDWGGCPTAEITLTGAAKLVGEPTCIIVEQDRLYHVTQLAIGEIVGRAKMNAIFTAKDEQKGAIAFSAAVTDEPTGSNSAAVRILAFGMIVTIVLLWRRFIRNSRKLHRARFSR